MTYLITGGAGFIGSHLVERLLKEGLEVVCLDSFDGSYDPALKRENIRSALDNPNFSLLEADIRQGFLLEGLFSKFDIEAVVHLAARTGESCSLEDPVGYAEVNVNETAQLLEYCRKFEVKNFVFASSAPVYGEGPQLPFSEDAESGAPLSPYAATKLAGEFLCQTYHRLCGMSVACLRLFTVYGPRQRPNMAIRSFAEKMLEGEEITIFGGGSSSRDYIYIDDLIEGIIFALKKRFPFEVINLGSGCPIQISEVVSALEETIGLKAKTEYLAPQPGEMEATWADISKAERLLDYKPRVSFQEGVTRFVEWLRERQKPSTLKDVAGEKKVSI
jgi:UDP-glucuronate 4-epimerase